MTDDRGDGTGEGGKTGRRAARAARKPSARRPAAKRTPAKQRASARRAKTPAKKASPKKPSAKKPSAKKPSAKKTLANEPSAKKPSAKKPSAKEASAKKPSAKKPSAKKASAKKASAKKASAKKPSANKASAKKPSAKRPAAKAPSAKRPAAKTSSARKRRVSKPEDRPSVPPPGVYVDAEELEAVADGSVPRFVEDGDDAQRSVDERLQDLERNLGGLLSDAGGAQADPAARRRAAEALEEIASRLAPGEGSELDDETLLGTARELLSSEYYFRQWGRVAMRNRSEEVDDFGLDPAYERRFRPLFHFLYEKWFRAELDGVDHVPTEGRAMVVANHSGTVPWDGIMLKTAIELEHPRDELRWLAEDFVFHMPFLGAFMNRIGAVRACQENAERLLSQERLVAVFPEGIKGIGKLFRKRYQLQRFGRGGYIKLALRTGTPIVPCAIVGAEEANPLLFKVTHLTRALGLPYVPVTPTFPWLGPFGLIPAPTRWHILFGEPIELDEHGPEAAEDAVLVNRLNERVRGTIQQMLDGALARRSSVFF